MSGFPFFPAMPLASPAPFQKMWQQFLENVARWPHVLEVAKKVRVGATPTKVILQNNKAKLLQYQSEAKPTQATPLLVVFALINRPYILDLKAGKSVVSHFIGSGFDTYNADWGVPTHSDRHLGLRDYIDGYLNEMVDCLRERSGCEKINILGYCMGGSMSAMYTALYPDKVKNLITMAAPVDWSSKEHLLAKWLDPAVFDVDKIIDTYGNAPADLLQNSFALLKPVGNYIEKYITFSERMHDDKYLEDFFAMETWLNDNIPMAGEMFREFVKQCMQENQLIQGRLRIGDRLVDLGKIRCPLLNLTAASDHLVPCVQCLPLNDAVGSTDQMAINFPAGHIGLAVGSKANRELWPKAAEWLVERNA